MKVNASGNKWCRAYGARRWWATRTQPLRAGPVSDATPSLERTTNLKVGHYKSKHKMAGAKVPAHTEEKSGPPQKAVPTKAKTEAPTLKKNRTHTQKRHVGHPAEEGFLTPQTPFGITAGSQSREIRRD
jgi:hypothetical protein